MTNYESKLDYAKNLYFSERHASLKTIHNEKIFEAGFKMAWDIKDKTKFGANHCSEHEGYGFQSDCIICKKGK